MVSYIPKVCTTLMLFIKKDLASLIRHSMQGRPRIVHNKTMTLSWSQGLRQGLQQRLVRILSSLRNLFMIQQPKLLPRVFKNSVFDLLLTMFKKLCVAPRTNQNGILLMIMTRVSLMKVEIPRWEEDNRRRTFLLPRSLLVVASNNLWIIDHWYDPVKKAIKLKFLVKSLVPFKRI